MSRGAIAGLALLLGAFAAAVFWQGSRRPEPPAGPDPVLDEGKGPAGDRLVLLAGGDRPRLPGSVLGERIGPAAVRPAGTTGRAQDGAGRRPRLPGAGTKPTGGRWVVLRPGETLYHLCIRVYGSSRRLAEILELNGLDEEAARRIRPGRRIFLP